MRSSTTCKAGNGWAFVARQKRMTIDNDDFSICCFARPLRRLIAVELKVGRFKSSPSRVR